MMGHINTQPERNIMRPTHDALNKILRYDAATGILTRKSTGKPVGSANTKGYLQVTINYEKYLVAHVIWCMVWHEWPQDHGLELDHVNRVPDDNRLVNLRLAGRRQQLRNRAMNRGIRRMGNGRWRVNIGAANTTKYVGTFTCFAHAVNARIAAETQFWE